MTDSMRIGKLATKLGVTTKTLRFYEKIGLIEHPSRLESGYRFYTKNQIDKAFIVVSLRRIGLTINELQQLKNDVNNNLLRKSLSSILDQKLFIIDQELGILQGKREDIGIRFQALVSTPHERLPNCICDLLLINCTCKTIFKKNN